MLLDEIQDPRLRARIEAADREQHPNRARHPGPVAELERHSRDAPLGAQEIQRPTGARILVRVTSVRTRLLDEDNLCEKYLVDLCRYAGMLPGDTPAEVKIEVGQRKAEKGGPESTIIEIL